MPTYDGVCGKCGDSYQYFVKKWTDADPNCPKCGTQVKRCFCAPNVIGARSEKFEEHYAYRKNSTDGNLERVLIDSRSRQKAFCKEEHLYDPYEVPEDVQLDEKGKIKSGMHSGAWI